MQNPNQTSLRAVSCVLADDGMYFAPIVGLFQTTVNHPGHEGIEVTLVNDALEDLTYQQIKELRKAWNHNIPYNGLLSEDMIFRLRELLVDRCENVQYISGRSLPDTIESKFSRIVGGEKKRVAKRNLTKIKHREKLFEEPPTIVKYTGEKDTIGFVYWPGKVVAINHKLIDDRYTDEEYRKLLRGITDAWYEREISGGVEYIDGTDDMFKKCKSIRPVLEWI